MYPSMFESDVTYWFYCGIVEKNKLITVCPILFNDDLIIGLVSSGLTQVGRTPVL